ncbi:hypothetical protein B0H13DRAFT_1033107 [Mycena leptocephala]|nr:hypothetical protein B0H13DRAFT_1033107 [Mycena leptocephala]
MTRTYWDSKVDRTHRSYLRSSSRPCAARYHGGRALKGIHSWTSFKAVTAAFSLQGRWHTFPEGCMSTLRGLPHYELPALDPLQAVADYRALAGSSSQSESLLRLDVPTRRSCMVRHHVYPTPTLIQAHRLWPVRASPLAPAPCTTRTASPADCACGSLCIQNLRGRPVRTSSWRGARGGRLPEHLPLHDRSSARSIVKKAFRRAFAGYSMGERTSHLQDFHECVGLYCSDSRISVPLPTTTYYLL